MTRRRRRACRAAAVAAWLLWTAAAPIAGDDEGRSDARHRLTFGVDAPRLASDAALRRWVATYLSRLLGLTGADHLGVDGPSRALGNYRVIRLLQTAKGLPVVYRESRLLLNRQSRPVHLLGYHSPFAEPPAVRPGLRVANALSKAGGRNRHPPSVRVVFWPDADELRLSYELGGAFPDAPGAVAPFERVYVDASTGEVLERLSLMRGALDRQIFDFASACRQAGIDSLVDYPSAELLLSRSPLVRSETQRTGRPSAAANRLFELLGAIHSFWDLNLERDSFDGSGGSLVAYLGVRFQGGIPWWQCIGDAFNAAWTGDNFMLLHNDALNFPSIIAHEVTHGLINATADLLYEAESGALDEAISDALGITFAAWLDSGAPRDANASLQMTPGDWQMRDPSGVGRDLRDPGSVSWGQPGRPYPDHYDDYVHLPLGPETDYGGVHINSSIINHGFYLLAQGSGSAVEGIGAMQAARIFGRAAELLGPVSDFRDARFAFAYAAEALHGRDSPEWVAVHTAMDVIGIPGSWDPPQTPLPADPGSTPPAPQPSPQTTPPAPQPSPQTTPPAPQPAPPAPQPAPPAPQPGPSPPPEPTDDDTSDAEDAPVGDDTSGNNAILVLSLVAGLTLLGAAGLMLRPRPRGSLAPGGSPPGRVPPPPGPKPPPPGPKPPPPPGPKPQSDAVLGMLRPEDGSPPIPLPLAQLSSREGLLIGRDSELCHVQIRHSEVSRRHVRLRVQEVAGSRSILIEDVNSLEGTRVDEVDLKPFEPQTIAPGQTLRIAGLSYRMQRKVELRFRP